MVTMWGCDEGKRRATFEHEKRRCTQPKFRMVLIWIRREERKEIRIEEEEESLWEVTRCRKKVGCWTVGRLDSGGK